MPASTCSEAATAGAMGTSTLPQLPYDSTAVAAPADGTSVDSQSPKEHQCSLPVGQQALAVSTASVLSPAIAHPVCRAMSPMVTSATATSAAAKSAAASSAAANSAAATSAPAVTSFLDLPITCQDLVIQLLPPNCIPLCIRQLSKELRQRYLQHNTVQAGGGHSYLPIWAVLAAWQRTVGRKQQQQQQQQQFMAALARRGDLDGMQQLAQHILPAGHQAVASNSAMLTSSTQQLLTRSTLCVTEVTLAAAAAYGHLHILQWLKAEGEQSFGALASLSSISTAAARGGHVHVLEHLRCHQLVPFAWDAAACAAAARGGHLHTLQWLRSHGCAWDRLTMYRAAEHGHLHVLSWAHEQGCPFDPMCCNTAAVNGHLGVLQYLFAQGYTTGGSDLSAAAAYGGRQHVLQWLREQGHESSVAACTNAARQGNCTLLRWLREQEPPCPWDVGVTRAAAMALAPGAPACLEYAVDNGCPWDDDVQHLVMNTPRLRHVRLPPMASSQGQERRWLLD